MTAKHFKDLADYIGGQYWRDSYQCSEIAEVLATWCSNQNSRFDRQRFIEAVDESAANAARTYEAIQCDRLEKAYEAREEAA